MDQKCETCRLEIEGRAPHRLMSDAGANRIMARFFCSPACYRTYATALNERGECAWCGGPVGGSTRKGGIEGYCSDDCYSLAGRALLAFELRHERSAGQVTGVSTTREGAEALETLNKLKRVAPRGLRCGLCETWYSHAEVKDARFMGRDAIAFTCPHCRVSQLHRGE